MSTTKNCQQKGIYHTINDGFFYGYPFFCFRGGNLFFTFRGRGMDPVAHVWLHCIVLFGIVYLHYVYNRRRFFEVHLSLLKNFFG